MHLRARVDMAPPTTTHVTLGLYFAFVWDLPCKVFLSLSLSSLSLSLSLSLCYIHFYRVCERDGFGLWGDVGVGLILFFYHMFFFYLFNFYLVIFAAEFFLFNIVK
jgi:hypothetical protein